MTRPHGILRAGFPYLTTLGMRRVTNFPTDISFGEDKKLYILMRSEGVATIRIWSVDDMEELTDELEGFSSYGTEDGQFIWPVNILTGPGPLELFRCISLMGRSVQCRPIVHATIGVG